MSGSWGEDDPAWPHSLAWFSELSRNDAELARFVAEGLERSGGSEGCTVCGDAPSLPLRRLRREATPGPSTLRLCGECRLIRRVLYAEMYEPL